MITGLKLLERDDAERAAAQFQHCKDPSLVSSPVLVRMASAFLDAGMYDRSIECADIIIKRDKKLSSVNDLVTAYTTKAHTLISLNKRTEADRKYVRSENNAWDDSFFADHSDIVPKAAKPKTSK